MEIYAPIANRLGLNTIFQELQDLCFMHLHPNRYSVLSKALKVARGNRREVVGWGKVARGTGREVVGKILDAIKHRLEDNHIRAEVKGREKHLYGIYEK